MPKSKFIKLSNSQLTDQISFTAKLTVADRDAKWSFKNKASGFVIILKDVQIRLVFLQAITTSGDFSNEKHQLCQGGGSFTLVIRNPSPEDTGCYRYAELFSMSSQTEIFPCRCALVNQEEIFCETYLDVQCKHHQTVCVDPSLADKYLELYFLCTTARCTQLTRPIFPLNNNV